MEGNMPASNHIHINLAKNLESSHFLYLLIPCQYVYIYVYQYVNIIHTYHILDIHFFLEHNSYFININLSPISNHPS